MTYKELKELLKDGEVRLERSDGHRDTIVTAINNTYFLFYNEIAAVEGASDNRELANYKSIKQEPVIETLYECISGGGIPIFLFADGRFPDFDVDSARPSGLTSESIKRKTGRTLKLNMKTFELIDAQDWP